MVYQCGLKEYQERATLNRLKGFQFQFTDLISGVAVCLLAKKACHEGRGRILVPENHSDGKNE